jgi:hypothetical protein
MKDLLAKMPYWKALTIALAGGAALLWLQGQIHAAISADNSRDEAVFASQSTVQDMRERVVRIEEKVDLLLRRK